MTKAVAGSRVDRQLLLRQRKNAPSLSTDSGLVSNTPQTPPAQAQSDIGQALVTANAHWNASQEARRAVAMEPNIVGGWNNFGIPLQEQGKLEESRLCLLRILEFTPQNAQTHNSLGNTCKLLGRLDEAEAHWSRALELEPNYPEPYSNLANLLTGQGELDGAEAMARKAIDLNPRFADAYLNLAGVETARQGYPETLQWLQALLCFAPSHPAGLAALAVTLKELDRLPEGIDAAQRAVAAAPDNPDGHHALGLVLQAAHRHEEALAAFEKAATLPGTAREKALMSRAVLHMELGRKEEARIAFDETLAVFPASAKSWFNLADMRRFSADDPAIPQMEALLGLNGVRSESDRVLLHFALGKAYLDIGASARAFQHLDVGNRMKRATITYDPDATERWLARIASTFSADLLRAKRRQGARSATPVFVLGMPRSGTTLIEQILASHPAVHGAGELRHIQKISDGIADYPTHVPGLARDQLAAMGRSYLGRVTALTRGRARVVDKMPANFIHAGLIRLILPDARIIHCRRDPVDTCLSCYSKLFAGEQLFAYDQTELGRFHRNYQSLMEHWRSVLPASHFLEVDYEAVVDDLGTQARRMLDFLGLPWDDGCLRFHETQRPVLTASVNQVREPIYRSSAGRWRAHAAQLQPLIAALGLA